MKELLTTEPVTTGYNCYKVLLKSTHFEHILERNGPEMHVLWPKQDVMTKSNFMQHLIVGM